MKLTKDTLIEGTIFKAGSSIELGKSVKLTESNRALEKMTQEYLTGYKKEAGEFMTSSILDYVERMGADTSSFIKGMELVISEFK